MNTAAHAASVWSRAGRSVLPYSQPDTEITKTATALTTECRGKYVSQMEELLPWEKEGWLRARGLLLPPGTDVSVPLQL